MEFDPNPFTNGTITKMSEGGINYYIIPSNFYLFKGTTSTDNLKLAPGTLSFFGVSVEEPEYIEDYEELYGIIFQYKTNREYKLLALDDERTMTKIYEEAPGNIKRILEKNYGYNPTGFRDSDGATDGILSQYLCGKGFQGYATNYMKTFAGGQLHPEFMICDVDGIELVKRITDDPRRIGAILEKGSLEKAARRVKEEREALKRRRRNNIRNDDNSDDMYSESQSQSRFSMRKPFSSQLFSSPPSSPSRQTNSSQLFYSPPSSPSRQTISSQLFNSPKKGGKHVSKKYSVKKRKAINKNKSKGKGKGKNKSKTNKRAKKSKQL